MNELLTGLKVTLQLFERGTPPHHFWVHCQSPRSSKSSESTDEWMICLVPVCRLMNTENSLLQTREEEGGAYERALVASQFVDWLVAEGEMATREEAEQLGRRLLEHGIIQHGEDHRQPQSPRVRSLTHWVLPLWLEFDELWPLTQSGMDSLSPAANSHIHGYVTSLLTAAASSWSDQIRLDSTLLSLHMSQVQSHETQWASTQKCLAVN